MKDEKDAARTTVLDTQGPVKGLSGASRESLLADKIGESANLLAKVINSKWDPRFDQIELAAMSDLGRLGAYAQLHPTLALKFSVRPNFLLEYILPAHVIL